MCVICYNNNNDNKIAVWTKLFLQASPAFRGCKPLSQRKKLKSSNKGWESFKVE